MLLAKELSMTQSRTLHLAPPPHDTEIKQLNSAFNLTVLHTFDPTMSAEERSLPERPAEAAAPAESEAAGPSKKALKKMQKDAEKVFDSLSSLRLMYDADCFDQRPRRNASSKKKTPPQKLKPTPAMSPKTTMVK